jgi:hypothetical protein
MRRLRRNTRRALQIAVIVALIGLALLPVFRAVSVCRLLNPAATDEPRAAAPPAEVQAAMQAADGYFRREDSTYLKLPEWYIVYSAEEYAAFIQDHPPSAFPYFAAIGQFWDSYYGVCAATVDRYTYNSEDQVVNLVIGVSFTAEYLVKGIYENTVGRVSEAISTDALTEEDAYAQRVAEEYGRFMHDIPWYDFPFAERLAGLWGDTGGWGPNVLRKWERKFALTLEYGTKAIYGWAIGTATRSSFVPPILTTYAWVENYSGPEAAVQVAAEFGDGSMLIGLPRYEGFSVAVPRLAARGVRFREIAGNDEIMLTLIAPRAWAYDLSAGEVLLTMPSLTDPDAQRLALNVPVRSLHTVLAELRERDFVIEHLYDY